MNPAAQLVHMVLPEVEENEPALQFTQLGSPAES
jgi:hypothetical protein